mmetsp:Transcript_101437/g.287226  ORF Transcript_101437/g.287226 Transcript_101437/m.287226 type:complete len:354 (-) Transcript_101437:149-1210(-)
MQPSTRSLLFLLLCRAAQPASSLAESWSWPWSRAASATPSWARGLKSPPKSWAPVHPASSELVEQKEESPAAQTSEEASEAPAAEQAAAEQSVAEPAAAELAVPGPAPSESQRAARLAAEQARAAEDEKGRLQELRVELEVKQRELDELSAKHAKGESFAAGAAKRAAKKAAAKMATDAEQSQDAQAEVDDKVQDLQAQLEAEEQRLKFQQRQRKIEAELFAKQRELAEAAEAQRAKAQAAAEAASAVEAARQAVSQAAEHSRAVEAARAEQAKAEARQHELKELAKKPGCYMRIPSGCPSKAMKTDKWRKDAWADKRGVDSQACQQRKGTWDTYCGSKDTEMIFVEAGDSEN